MIPYRLAPTSATRDAIASPSLSMEKGAYRMRAPRRRADTLRPAVIRRPQTVISNQDGRITAWTALVIVFLVTAALSSFGTAYYLFTTRWDTRAVPFVLTPNLKAKLEHKAGQHYPRSKANVTTAMILYPDSDERFLSYLPHSGFHNQRIALENALVLARLLNRTLLVPPVRLATKPLYYAPFDTLRKHLSYSNHDLQHCSTIPSYLPTPRECFPWTTLPWEWFVDLSIIKSRQRLVHCPNVTSGWILDHLQISEDDTYTIADSDVYQYRFLDTLMDPSSLDHKFQEVIQASQLALRTDRLIQLGTLFGSSRLLLRRRENILIRGEIRRSMAFANPHLVSIADSIAKELGGGYLGAHIRLGDGVFKSNRESNAGQIWWNLVSGILQVDVNDTAVLERRARYPDTISLPPVDPPANLSTTLSCRGRKYTSPSLQRLNTPLFISTDAPHPLRDPTIAVFVDTFPCTFFLSDFPHLTASLDELRNEEDDGVMLKGYLLPFLDAMVVGKAWAAVGTEGSTFSRFVLDVLWRTYHGRDIVQRG